MTPIKLPFKMLSVFLAVVLLVLAVPMTLYAEAAEALTAEDETAGTVSSSGASGLDAAYDEVFEDTSLREESVKHFRLSDGSYVAYQYSGAVHMLAEDGSWQDIDNRLSENGSEFSSSDARIKFVKKITGNESIFTLHEGNHKITMALDGAIKKTPGEATNTETAFDESATLLQKLTTLDHLSSRVIYRDILDGVDLEYLVNGRNVKENLIVKKAPAESRWTFTLKLNHLTAALSDANDVLLCDGDTVLYRIPAPTVWDADGNFAPDGAAYYTLTALGENRYSLAITVDEAWMQADDRAYPVTVDPTLGFGGEETNIIDTNISSAYPDSDSGSHFFNWVSSDYQTYWRNKNGLPTIPRNGFVISASFLANYWASSALNGSIAVYRVTQEWEDDLTINDVVNGVSGGIDATCYDYANVSVAANFTQDNTQTVVFDITKIVQGWLDGTYENHGICLKAAPDKTFTGTARIFAHDYCEEDEDGNVVGIENRPVLYIQYRYMDGVEPYWSTVSQSVGLAGTGSVNVKEGYLTFVYNGLSTNEAILPYTPSYVYNSKQSLHDISMGNINGVGFGILDVAGEEITEREGYYIWFDSDGTAHAFVQVHENLYQDEDGLGNTLVVSSDTSSEYRYIRSTPDDYYYYYDDNGFLIKEEDAWGNQRIYERNTNRLTKVLVKPADSTTEWEQISLTYSSSTLLLSSIQYEATGYVLKFLYGDYDETPSLSGSGFLRKIELYTSNTASSPYLSVEYEYTATGLLTAAIDNFNHSKVCYTWTSDGRVSKVEEYTNTSGSWLKGQTVSFAYQVNGQNKTTVTTSGTDDLINSTDDTVTHYVFDSFGRTVTCYVTDGNDIVQGTTGVSYVDTAESGYSAQENKISQKTTAGRSGVNYLLNGTLDASYDYWVFSGATGSVSSISTRDKAVKLKYTEALTTPSGMYQSVTLVPGTYTFSADVRMGNTSSNVTARLKVTNSTGTTTIASSNSLTNNSTINYYAKYIPLSVTFTVTATTTYRFYVEVSASATSATTYCYVNDIALTKGDGISLISLIRDGSFEKRSGAVYTYWTRSNTRVSYSTSDYYADSNALKVNGSPAYTGYAKQTISLMNATEISNVQTNATEYTGGSISYVLSGYAKATSKSSVTQSAVKGFDGSEATFALAARVKYLKSDGTIDSVGDIYLFSYDTRSTDWQYISGNIATDPSKGHPYQIDIICSYNYNLGTALFDNIVLVKATEGVSYSYDADGFVTYTVDASTGLSISYERSGVDVLRESRSDGITTTRTYQNHKVTSETTTDRSMTTETAQMQYQYNECGLQIFSSTLASYDAVEAVGDLSYSEIYYDYETAQAYYGQPKTVTTHTGVSRYFYYTSGTSNGLVKAVIGENGKGTSYTYDSLGRQTSAKPAEYANSTLTVLSGEEYVNYSYSSADLVSVTTASTRYGFTYNSYGNRDSVTVGGQKIVRYLYNSYNGKLRYIIYANGYIERYDYDALDRISKVWYYEGGSISASDSTIQGYTYTQATEYVYNAEGAVSEFIDYVAGERYVYRYDAVGKLESICSYYLDGTTVIVTDKITQSYDDYNRLSSVQYVHRLGSSTYNYTGSFVYDTLGRVVSYTENGFATAYTYLPMGMLDEQTVTNGSLSVDTAYSYEESAASGDGLHELTGRVSGTTVTVTYSTTQKSQNAYTFTYDAAGNITAIRVGGVLKLSYEYDNLNQLTRENNAYTSKTYVYTYDNAGNIVSKKTYAYTTGTLGSVTSTNTYSYSSSTWGDQLTAFNGISFTYDALGNPLQYYNGNSYTFTWQKGRQLSKTVNGGVTTTYTYNSDGIRTGKTVGGVAVEYVLNGTQILAEKNGDHIIRYFYDVQGIPVGMTFNGTVYLFEKNSQGDVIALWTATGTKVASYVYDAWGNLVSESVMSSHQTASDLNPFRYRGYYYDQETGFYYLQSRYYDPATGRFLNADGYINANNNLQGFNMYAYCSNNPIMYVDRGGEWAQWVETLAKIGAATLAVVAAAVTVVAVTAFTSGTGTIAAVKGATIFLGVALSGINGGVFNQEQGDSFLNGYIGGATGGVIQGICSKTTAGFILGGGAGVAVGTVITDVLDNLDPYSANSTPLDIFKNALSSGGKALITSSLTAYMGYASDLAQQTGANGLMPTFTYKFAEAFKVFWGWLDDAFVYLWGDEK